MRNQVWTKRRREHARRHARRRVFPCFWSQVNEIKNDKKGEQEGGETRSEKTGQRLTSNEKQTRVASLFLSLGPSGVPSIDYVFLSVQNVSHSSPTILQTPRTHFFPPPNAITGIERNLETSTRARNFDHAFFCSQLLLDHRSGQSRAILNYLADARLPAVGKTWPNPSLGKFRTADRKLIRRCWADRGQPASLGNEIPADQG